MSEKDYAYSPKWAKKMMELKKADLKKMCEGILQREIPSAYSKKDIIWLVRSEKTDIQPHNLLENLDIIGGWSAYYLAEIAFRHYYPELCSVSAINKQLDFLSDKPENSFNWDDWIIKYQTEVGYKGPFSRDYVNPA